jgi:predicted glycosyl hydrolase (DUF1957 family)
MDLEDIEVDVGKEGWIDKIPQMDDLELHVAAWENPSFKKMRKRMIDARPRNERSEGLPQDVLDQINGICMLETILKDWKNVRLKGVEQPYSKDLAKKLLTSTAWGEFRDACQWAAQKVAKVQAATEKVIEGNSPASSPGGASGEAIPTS